MNKIKKILVYLFPFGMKKMKKILSYFLPSTASTAHKRISVFDKMCAETDFFEYFSLLKKASKDLLIIAAVKDTIGVALDDATASVLQKCGFKTNFAIKHQHSYIAVIDGGITVTEQAGNRSREIVGFKLSIDGQEINVLSRALKVGNRAKITINHVDYCVNARGLNIVVIYKPAMNVIDSLCFDTLLPDKPCARLGDLAVHTLYDIDSSANNLRNDINKARERIHEAIFTNYRRGGELLPHTKARFFMDMPKADGNLRAWQLLAVKLLSVFHEICVSNDINYWIYGGTLLGAVRHGGFIPWDDDLDIAITRDDFDRFAHILKNDERYAHLHLFEAVSCADGHIVHMFQFSETDWDKKFCALWIDIFPYDYVDYVDDTVWETYLKMKKDLVREVLCLPHGTEKVGEDDANRWVKIDSEEGAAIVSLFKQYTEKIQRLFSPKSLKQGLLRGIDNIFLPYDEQGYFLFTGERRYVKCCDVFPLKLVSFENIQVMAPRNPVALLENIYGNIYMLPNNIGYNHGHTSRKRRIIDNMVLEHDVKDWAAEGEKTV